MTTGAVDTAPTVAPSTGPVMRVLGIRHHGPGSARAVVAALDELAPDVVLIEGPADADPLVALAASDAMRPPVALFAYAPEAPHVAAFWPFAVFSPEWGALRWATGRGVPVRFCDLPTGQVLAGRDAGPVQEELLDDRPDPETVALRNDPVAALAAAAGYDDAERWWDDVVESRTDGVPPFDALTEAMTDLRAAVGELPGRDADRERRREAHMRQVLRAVLKDGAQRVAVVCGAWHAPALTAPLPPAAADARLLRGAPRRKTVVTWVPWTHTRLAAASGYGAGITSPGWYHHLFTVRDRPVTRWLSRVARTLRAHDLPVSSAHVIEAVRLADTLAALRGRPLAGLAELTDATRSVLCDGDEVALRVVTTELVVGEAMGEVPPEAPTVPLEADLRAQARRLRLRLDPLARTVTLDLRKDTDVAKSRLLRRLQVLGLHWAVPGDDGTRTTGTFKETWDLQWTPELVIGVVEASVWGATVEAAAGAKLTDLAGRADRLDALTGAVGHALGADLPDALGAVLRAVADLAATDHDVVHLMAALPDLVRALRYGSVLGVDTASLGPVADTLLVRVCTGLPGATAGLGDDAAAELRARLDGVHAGVLLREDDPAGRARWLATLEQVAAREGVHGAVAGRVVRLLLDTGTWSLERASTALARALSTGPTAGEKAAWVEGFLSGSAQLLIHDDALLALLDGWVAELDGDEFLDALPLLRRTFGRFAGPERRLVGDRVRTLGDPSAATGSAAPDVDLELAAPALRAVARILAVSS